MSKVLLHFCTEIGPRTVVAEISDAATARAVVNAHLAVGELASLVEEMPRLSVKDLVAKRKRVMARDIKMVSIPALNVTPIRKRRPNG